MSTLCTNATTLSRFPAGASAQQDKKNKWVRKDLRNFGELQQWLPPRGCTAVHSSHTLARVRPERCLALVHRRRSLEGYNTKQTTVSSIGLFSQSRLQKWGPRKNDYIIPVCLYTAFFCQPKPGDTNRRCSEERGGGRCRAQQWRTLGNFVCWPQRKRILINQPIYWHIKPISRKCWEFLHKIQQKAACTSFKFCQNTWQMCTISQVPCCGGNVAGKTAPFSHLLPCHV